MFAHHHRHPDPAASDHRDQLPWQAIGQVAHALAIALLVLLVLAAAGVFGPADHYGGWRLLLVAALVGSAVLAQAEHLLESWQPARHPLQIAVLLGCLAAALLLPAAVRWLSRLGADDLFVAVVLLATAAMLGFAWTQRRWLLRRR